MDANRRKPKPKGKTQRRQRHILVDPNVVAVRGWEKIKGCWTATTCKAHVQWCHIDKLFPYHRHKMHLKTNMANLHACTHDGFVQRCIEVYRYLYKTRSVPRNEVPLFLCEMVYVEVILQRMVDWSTIKGAKLVDIPSTKDIPRAGPSPNPREGLGKKIFIKNEVPNVAYVWSDHESSGDESMDDEKRDTTTHVGDTLANLEEVRVEAAPMLTFPPLEGMPRIEASVDTANIEADENFEMKEFYKVQLKMVLDELAKENEEKKALEEGTVVDDICDDVPSLEALIESGRVHLSKQHEEMLNLEAFYVNFSIPEGEGSSSSANKFAEERLAKIKEDCHTEAQWLENEKKSLEVAQSKILDLSKKKDKAPLDRIVAIEGCEGLERQYETLQLEAEDLKKKLISALTLESDVEKELRRRKLSLVNAQSLKAQYFKNKWWDFPINSNLQSAYKEVTRDLEAKKRQKLEDQGQ